MSKRYPIINPNASCVIGMYVNELVGMDHPIASIRLTSQMKANLCYQQGVPLKKAIESILGHISYLFGDDIPDQLVRVTVYVVYAENTALKVKKTSPQPQVDYIARWLERSREAQKSSNIEGNIDATAAKKVHNEGSHKRYPGIFFRCGPVGGRAPIPENATKDEILAQAMLVAMHRPKVSVAFSEADTIVITSPNWHAQLNIEYPYIAACNRFLKYPADTTKEELIDNAARIAATWCPKALVAWSSTETIWPS